LTSTMGKTLPPPPPPDLKNELENAQIAVPQSERGQAFLAALLQLCRDHNISLHQAYPGRLIVESDALLADSQGARR
jgi:hypothetical protein